MFKTNSGKIGTMCEIYPKLIINDQTDVNDILLWCFHCLLWTNKMQDGLHNLLWFINISIGRCSAETFNFKTSKKWQKTAVMESILGTIAGFFRKTLKGCFCFNKTSRMRKDLLQFCLLSQKFTEQVSCWKLASLQ